MECPERANRGDHRRRLRAILPPASRLRPPDRADDARFVAFPDPEAFVGTVECDRIPPAAQMAAIAFYVCMEPSDTTRSISAADPAIMPSQTRRSGIMSLTYLISPSP